MAKKKKKTGPKKGGVNKSSAIREFAKAHPKMGPTEVCRELKKKGVSVTVSLVSGVLNRKKSKARRKPGRPPGTGRKLGRLVASATAANDKVSLSALLQARDFAEKVGGLDKAEAIIKALRKLS